MISMHLRGRTKKPVRLIGGWAAVFMVLTMVAAALSPDVLDQRKREVARASLERLGRADAETLVESASRAEALTDIHVDGSEAQVVLTVEITGQPTCKAFTTEDGKKIVLDIEGAVNLQAGRVFVPAKQAIVQQVRTSLFTVEPQYVSRVVADLAGPGRYVMERGDGHIRVTITNGQANPPTQPVLDAKNIDLANKTKATLEAVRKEVQESGSRWLGNGVSRVRAAARTASAASMVVSSRVRDGFMILANQQKSVPSAAPVAQRVQDLARDLEMVKASEVELRLPPLARLAQIAPESPPPTEAGGSPEPPPPSSEGAQPEAQAGDAKEPPPPSSEGAKPEAQAGDAKEPPPPPKRSSEERKPTGGVEAVGRMKQLLSGIAGMPPNPAEGGLVTTPKQVDAQAVPAEIKQESNKKAEGKTETPAEEPLPFVGDPMEQVVSIDLREMDLTNVVALLAQKAQINVIAGTQLKGVVTANLKNITLRKAIDTVLRMNNLGIIQEEGIYRIVPYEEAVAAKRKTLMVKLESAKVEDLQKTLQDVIKGTPDDNLISISTDKQTNTLILAGPEMRIAELEKLAHDLDIAKPATPTVTEAIKINNSDPETLLPLVMAMKSKDIGSAAVDVRSRTLVITDVPVVIEQIRELIAKLDTPVKQVNIETMIVEAKLADNGQTGAQWVCNALTGFAGTLTGLGMTALSSAVSPTQATAATSSNSTVTFGLLTAHTAINAAIQGQVQANNAKLLASPLIVSVENKKAAINITQEIPYELSQQATTGPPMTSTAFKEVGIILNVTPAVSHDEYIVTDLDVTASTLAANNVVGAPPTTDKRQTKTTLRSANGQTIYIGGLRQLTDTHGVTKTPILGDIPLVNLLFRTNNITKQRTELMIFLTCSVLPDEPGPITTEQEKRYNELEGTSLIPNSQHTLIHQTIQPGEFRDPAWKYRRPVEDGPLIPKAEKPPRTKTKRPLRPERID